MGRVRQLSLDLAHDRVLEGSDHGPDLVPRVNLVIPEPDEHFNSMHLKFTIHYMYVHIRETTSPHQSFCIEEIRLF